MLYVTCFDWLSCSHGMSWMTSVWCNICSWFLGAKRLTHFHGQVYVIPCDTTMPPQEDLQRCCESAQGQVHVLCLSRREKESSWQPSWFEHFSVSSVLRRIRSRAGVTSGWRSRRGMWRFSYQFWVNYLITTWPLTKWARGVAFWDTDSWKVLLLFGCSTWDCSCNMALNVGSNSVSNFR